MANGAVSALYVALTGFVVVLTAFLQEILRAKREKRAAEKKAEEDKEIARKKAEEDTAAAALIARKVEEVKQTLIIKDEQTSAKLQDIYHLCNKPLATALKAVALAYRERAERPEATAHDKLAAENAEQDYRDHEQKQARVDENSNKKLKEAKEAKEAKE
jgi:hypothetical protein